MRTASQEIASQILKQVGNSLSLLVQYNPDGKYICPIPGLGVHHMSIVLCVRGRYLRGNQNL
jgi:hypothetical protein